MSDCSQVSFFLLWNLMKKGQLVKLYKDANGVGASSQLQHIKGVRNWVLKSKQREDPAERIKWDAFSTFSSSIDKTLFFLLIYVSPGHIYFGSSWWLAKSNRLPIPLVVIEMLSFPGRTYLISSKDSLSLYLNGHVQWFQEGVKQNHFKISASVFW